MIQTALESLLRGRGHDIVGTATSGAEASERIAQSMADIIVLDVQMPGGSGIHVLKEMRSRGDNRPVVLLTAAVGDEALRDALSLDVGGIVLKSSDPVLLMDAIDQAGKGETWIDDALKERVAAAAAQGRAKRPLSERERLLIDLVRKGLKNRDIAVRMDTTEGTVKAYLHALFDKLGVENRTELAMKADQIIGPAAAV
jgi:two-component system nitrate/nitrite response regulator NarP